MDVGKVLGGSDERGVKWREGWYSRDKLLGEAVWGKRLSTWIEKMEGDVNIERIRHA